MTSERERVPGGLKGHLRVSFCHPTQTQASAVLTASLEFASKSTCMDSHIILSMFRMSHHNEMLYYLDFPHMYKAAPVTTAQNALSVSTVSHLICKQHGCYAIDFCRKLESLQTWKWANRAFFVVVAKKIQQTPEVQWEGFSKTCLSETVAELQQQAYDTKPCNCESIQKIKWFPDFYIEYWLQNTHKAFIAIKNYYKPEWSSWNLIYMMRGITLASKW